MQKSYVIGLEGGGTTTRVMVSDLQGNILAYKESGSSHPHKDLHAKQHIEEAFFNAINEAKIKLNEIHFFTAGLPGYDKKEDITWLKPLIDIKGLSCSRLIVNDSEVGHAGAFLFEPGIMAISGTGSNIMGYNENEQIMFNGSVGHYAPTASRFLSNNAVFKILAGQVEPEDKPLVHKIMNFWGTHKEQEFRDLAFQQFDRERMERDLQLGLMAPIITEAALENIPLAIKVCDEAVQSLETGIRLVGNSFQKQSVKVCFIGSVIRSPYIRKKLTYVLEGSSNKSYRVVEPNLSPVAGAVAMSLKECGIKISQNILDNLSQHAQSKVDR